MSTRHLLTIEEFSPGTVADLLETATRVKADPHSFRERLQGKSLAMIFEKPSLRTRVSFELAILQLGGHPVHLARGEISLGKRESVADVTRVLERWVDAVMVRTFAHRIVEEMAGCSRVPIINGLTDLHHPCQALSDLLTIQESKGRLSGLRIAYVGDGNNVAHSLALAAARSGLRLRIVTPPGSEPAAAIIETARRLGADTGAEIEVGTELAWGLPGVDVIYTDVWASMGQEEESAAREVRFRAYQIDAEAMKKAAPSAIFMHSLPAHRGAEVTAEVADSDASVIFTQAENRLHMQKAILLHLLLD